nr:hypothetical protein [Dyella sp. ASV24]
MAKADIAYNPSIRPVYLHLEPIVDLLLAHGNELSKEYKWGEDRTGFYCALKRPLDFERIETTFNVPSFVRFDRDGDVIECDKTWATIRGGVE